MFPLREDELRTPLGPAHFLIDLNRRIWERELFLAVDLSILIIDCIGIKAIANLATDKSFSSSDERYC